MNLHQLAATVAAAQSAVDSCETTKEQAFQLLCLEWGIDCNLAIRDLGSTDLWGLLGYIAWEYPRAEVERAIHQYC